MKKKLTIIPIPDARLIPSYLVEQVKERNWTVDEWYSLQLKQMGNSSNVLLGLVDKRHQVKGFIWLTIDGFNKLIHINTLSVDREYQRKSKLINFVTNYIRKLARGLEIGTVIWTAKRTRALERYGFTKSDDIIMEGQV